MAETQAASDEAWRRSRRRATKHGDEAARDDVPTDLQVDVGVVDLRVAVHLRRLVRVDRRDAEREVVRRALRGGAGGVGDEAARVLASEPEPERKEDASRSHPRTARDARRGRGWTAAVLS